MNPTAAIDLPAVRGKRDPIASPAEAAALLDAHPARDHALSVSLWTDLLSPPDIRLARRPAAELKQC